MDLTSLLITATVETLLMCGLSMLIGCVIGLPLGACLFNHSENGLAPRPTLYRIMSMIVNMMRSLPFIILIILLIPVTRFIVGSAIGTFAAVVPLSICALFLIARATEDTLSHLPRSLCELGVSLGITPWQTFFHILLAEGLPTLVSALTTITITVVGFSAMAGTVGGGGLGDLAIRYGYQRYDIGLMLQIVLILIFLVQSLQWAGQRIARHLQH